jgi:DNA primase
MKTQTVLNTVTDLGITTVQQGEELWGQCPLHKERTGREDRNPSWSINKDTGAHFCFSCGYSGNLVTLVRDIKGDTAAKDFATEIETLGRTSRTDTASVKHKSLTLLNKARKLSERPVVQESDLYIYKSPPRDAMGERGLYEPSVFLYGVLWDPDDSAWILPFRHPDTSVLLGWQRKAHSGRFFHNEPYGLPKSSTLFGYDAASGYPQIAVVESPLDAVRLHSLGYPAVAVAGSKVSQTQEQLLSGFDRIIIALDNDAAGTTESKRLYRRLPNALFPAYPSNSYKDVGDMPKFLVHRMFGRYWP